MMFAEKDSNHFFARQLRQIYLVSYLKSHLLEGPNQLSTINGKNKKKVLGNGGNRSLDLQSFWSRGECSSSVPKILSVLALVGFIT
jgi:hypothetical protein